MVFILQRGWNIQKTPLSTWRENQINIDAAVTNKQGTMGDNGVHKRKRTLWKNFNKFTDLKFLVNENRINP